MAARIAKRHAEPEKPLFTKRQTGNSSFNITQVALNVSHDGIQNEITKWMSTTKITNKNQEIDVKETCINYQDSETLTEVMYNPFSTTFKPFATCRVIITNLPRLVINH